MTVYPQDFRSALGNSSLPSGELSLMGGLRYQHDAAIPMLRSVVLDGQLASRELLVSSPQLRTTLSNLRGQFQLANGNLQGHHIVASPFLARHAHISDYATNPPAWNKRSRALPRALKEQVWQYIAGRGCVDCGEADPVVLDFDHVDPGSEWTRAG